MKRFERFFLTAVILGTLAMSSCMNQEDAPKKEEVLPSKGVFIVNQGNFNYSNSSLDFFSTEDGKVHSSVFLQANRMKLGDVAQSMTIHENNAWIAVNNSGVIYAIDTDTALEWGRIEGLTSPRYIHILNSKKGYITQMYDNRIAIFDPSRNIITGYITVPNMSSSTASTESMVQIGDFLFVTCWSYQKDILKIDTVNDKIVERKQVGIQPYKILKDKNNKIWCYTDGGSWEGNPVGFEQPKLMRIDPETLDIEKEYTFQKGAYFADFTMDLSGEEILWADGNIWKMSIMADKLPQKPFIDASQIGFLSCLAIDPESKEIYAADCLDYTQRGWIYRFSYDGELLGSFPTGISPIQIISK